MAGGDHSLVCRIYSRGCSYFGGDYFCLEGRTAPFCADRKIYGIGLVDVCWYFALVGCNHRARRYAFVVKMVAVSSYAGWAGVYCSAVMEKKKTPAQAASSR
ncbi:hypothetical protein D1872_240410 [compost metagenome]